MLLRLIGLAVALVLSVAGAFLPLGDWWAMDSDFVPIPGGVAAGFGIAVAGFVVAPRLETDRRRLGLVAIRFALVAFGVAVPLVAIDAAVVSARPLDEPWPVAFDPVLGTLAGTATYIPNLLIVAVPAGGLWTALATSALRLYRRRVTFGVAD